MEYLPETLANLAAANKSPEENMQKDWNKICRFVNIQVYHYWHNKHWFLNYHFFNQHVFNKIMGFLPQKEKWNA